MPKGPQKYTSKYHCLLVYLNIAKTCSGYSSLWTKIWPHSHGHGHAHNEWHSGVNVITLFHATLPYLFPIFSIFRFMLFNFLTFCRQQRNFVQWALGAWLLVFHRVVRKQKFENLWNQGWMTTMRNPWTLQSLIQFLIRWTLILQPVNAWTNKIKNLTPY